MGERRDELVLEPAGFFSLRARMLFSREGVGEGRFGAAHPEQGIHRRDENAGIERFEQIGIRAGVQPARGSLFSTAVLDT